MGVGCVGERNEKDKKTSAGKVEEELRGKGIVWRERKTTFANASLWTDVWKLLGVVKIFLDGFFLKLWYPTYGVTLGQDQGQQNRAN